MRRSGAIDEDVGAAMTNTAAPDDDTPDTPSQTLYSCTAALEEHAPEDAARIIRALASFFGVDLVQVVEHLPPEAPR